MLCCLMTVTAFGQSADIQKTVKYPVGTYTPKGDFGAYLEGVTVGLYLVPGRAPNNEGSGTLYNKVDLQVKVWTDPVKKYKYNGKTYTDLCGTSFKGYSKVKIQVAIAGVGTKTITIADNDAIDFPLNRLYKDEELNQIKVTSFKLIEMLPKESERKDVAHCVGKQSEQAAKNDNASGSNGAGDKADDAEQSSSESSQTSGSSSERGSTAHQPRQQSNHEENIRKYNAINRQVAAVDNAHNEFNNAIDKAFAGMDDKIRADQQASRDWWEDVKSGPQIGARELELENEHAFVDPKQKARFQKAVEAQQRRMELELKRRKALKNRKPGEYDFKGDFVEGMAVVRYGSSIDGMSWGFIDKTGKEVIPLKYDEAGNFKDGLAKVKQDGQYGYIDKNGKEIIPIDYIEISDFDAEGLAWFYQESKESSYPYHYGIIRRDGSIISDFLYNEKLTNPYSIYYYAGVYSKEGETAYKMYMKIPENETYWYKNAASKLGDIFFEGKGKAVDYKKAFNYYKTALMVDKAERMGDMAYNGYGVTVNKDFAFECYRAALENHEAEQKKEREKTNWNRLAFTYNKDFRILDKYLMTACDLGKFDLAKSKLEQDRSKRKDKDAIEILFMKGYIAETIGDIREAKKYYKKASKGSPKDFYTQQSIKRLNKL